ncbi:MAG TPA: cupin domain-containing protein [Gaiellaceae bacterium]|jgi:mannose-6-phosphate isomerase-like protein (cupin superfamily)|nr:cupin domain-containing protein [Gaiellaceae bacterium]
MELLDRRVAPDVVSDLLRAVRVRSTVYCRSHIGAPWGFGVEAHGNPSFHVVTEGACLLEVDGEDEPRPLRTGDLVVLPTGPRHWMRDAPGSPTPLLEDILSTVRSGNGRLRHGGDGQRAELICGGFALEGDAADPILRALPTVLHMRSTASGPVPWVAATLELLAAVSASDAPGVEAVLARLADAMLTQALRLGLAEFAAAHPEHARALRDPIARAVQLVHREPERRWTVDDLAAAVGYSRSAFAARFREARRRGAARLCLPDAARPGGDAARAAGPNPRRGGSAHGLCERVLLQPSVQARVRRSAGPLSLRSGFAGRRRCDELAEGRPAVDMSVPAT